VDTVVVFQDEENSKLTKFIPQNTISHIIKRGGVEVSFNEQKISDAIFNALGSASSQNKRLANQLSSKVVKKLIETGFQDSRMPTAEDIQDVVLLVLIENGHNEVARNYIFYRMERRIFCNSNILKDPLLTTEHKKILGFLNDLSNIKGTLDCFNPLKREYNELEKIGYLIINKNPFGGLSISLNPNQSSQLKALLTPKIALSQ